jgi:hypothetical protein
VNRARLTHCCTEPPRTNVCVVAAGVPPAVEGRHPAARTQLTDALPRPKFGPGDRMISVGHPLEIGSRREATLDISQPPGGEKSRFFKSGLRPPCP